MSRGMTIERFHTYRVRVCVRRGRRFRVKPAAQALDGRTITVTAGWPIGESDSALYAGEWALRSPELEPYGITWIASGDVEVLEEVEYRRGG